MEPEQPPREFKFTADQLRSIRLFRLIMAPARLLLLLAFMSLITGGTRRFFGELPGQIFALLYTLLVLAERFFQAPDYGGKWKDAGSVGRLWMAFAITYVLAILDYYWLQPHWCLFPWSWEWVVVGIGLFVVGETIRVLAIRTLGRYFTLTVRAHDDHQLVQSGLYRLVRHPAYTGYWLINLGFITLFASVIAYVFFLVLGTYALLKRIRVEEEVLVGVFGDAYRSYQQKTKRLVPFLF